MRVRGQNHGFEAWSGPSSGDCWRAKGFRWPWWWRALEFGRSAYKLAPIGEVAQWQDTPVLRTDQSFTVSAWVRPDNTSQHMTFISQPGAHESAFWMKLVPDAAAGWQFCLTADDSTAAPSVAVTSTSAADVTAWTHLVGVYDARTNEARLYVNGVLEGTSALSFAPFTATRPLAVGYARWHDQDVDEWMGGIDDVQAFQGAMTDARVLALYESQAAG